MIILNILKIFLFQILNKEQLSYFERLLKLFVAIETINEKRHNYILHFPNS